MAFSHFHGCAVNNIGLINLQETNEVDITEHPEILQYAFGMNKLNAQTLLKWQYQTQDKDFLRRRKLDFKKMMRLIISMESGSMNHELLKFFNYDFSAPTSSAFYQQRSKLSVSAFRHLLREFNLNYSRLYRESG